ncbi:MAG: PD-(D/E)XK nuclease family protein [Lactobacillaceae bacterium]|jgi:ATP-dependent helicase/nuclease subunit B|nr:PD-(D/E)XK nuclease family protein [Lactobacillaceae bacterium]
MAKIYNIPSSCSFVDTLAEKFVKEYQDNALSLVDVMFLMPNRRACGALKEAFIRVRGLEPLMLPKIAPIGDVEEDEILISGFDVFEDMKNISPAIDKTERILLFTKIILSKPKDFGLERMSARQAAFLANELANLIDIANYEGLSFANLKNLAPEEYAEHWQETLKFLEIITKYWPDILQERGLVDPSFRYNQLLNAQSELWKQTKTNKRIVIAGGVANFPAIKNLVKTVLALPNGEFYINGLDKYLDEESWDVLDESHPEYDMKLLLEGVGIKRGAVKDLVLPQNPYRERLASEVMRPARTSDKWRNIKEKNLSHLAWRGVSVVECDTSQEEALAVSLIMREVLETPEKTAALVTSDRNLARRVAVELERWGIKVDDSAGRPLSLTPAGVYFRLIIEACTSSFAPVEFLSLLKHPFTAGGFGYGEFRSLVRDYEHKMRQNPPQKSEKLDNFINRIKAKLESLCTELNKEKSDLANIIKLHVQAAEELAAASGQNGSQILWKNEDGESLAKFIANLYEKAPVLENIACDEYLGFLESLMINVTVRTLYGTHPRLKILGPIEARLNSFDTVIIGGVNEGIWPKLASADPWMSRPMKRDFGFPLPEKNIGILAKDFASLLANREVYLTHANRVDGAPMIKSRWLMRLETVIAALGINIEEIENSVYSQWAKKFNEVKEYKKLLPPEPRPPVSSRPRKLSASGIDALIRDPYIVFARYILRLKPLAELNPDLTAADYGNIIHDILNEFNKTYPTTYPENSKGELLRIGGKYFEENAVALETRAFWWPKFEKTVDWLVEQEKAYRKDIVRVHSEVEGLAELDAPAGKFVITAKADRIDETKNSGLNVIDYKTGQAGTKKQIEEGYAPQLPIEGFIASSGGYEDIPPKEIENLIYWKLNDKDIVVDESVEEIIDDNIEKIKSLIALFDFETTPYMSKPNPKYVTANKDYEHLARVSEWSVTGGSDD